MLGTDAPLETGRTLYPGVWVGDDSSIGEESILHANVSIYPGTIIGNESSSTAAWWLEATIPITSRMERRM